MTYNNVQNTNNVYNWVWFHEMFNFKKYKCIYCSLTVFVDATVHALLWESQSIERKKVRNSENDDQYSEAVIITQDLAGLFFLWILKWLHM